MNKVNNDPTMVLPKLSESGEQAWTEFRYHVEWAEGFALIFLFSSDPAITALFLKRLKDIFATRVSTVQFIAPKQAERLAETVLSAIRNPEDEYRDMLRSRTQRPVILSLPGGYRQRAREIAPDLWAVRNFSLVLDDIKHPEFGALALPEKPEYSDIPLQTSVKNTEYILNEWIRLVSHGSTGRHTIMAGWRAIEAALSLGKTEQATAIAEQVATMARNATSTDVSEATPA